MSTPQERYAEFLRLWAEGDWEKIAAWQESERQRILAFVAESGVRGGVENQR